MTGCDKCEYFENFSTKNVYTNIGWDKELSKLIGGQKNISSILPQYLYCNKTVEEYTF